MNDRTLLALLSAGLTALFTMSSSFAVALLGGGRPLIFMGSAVGGVVGLAIGQCVTRKLRPNAAAEDVTLLHFGEGHWGGRDQIIGSVVVLAGSCLWIAGAVIGSIRFEIAGQFILGVYWTAWGLAQVTHRKWKWAESRPDAPHWAKVLLLFAGILWLALAIVRIIVDD